MSYKVGEQVRVRKDLIVGNMYDGIVFCANMKGIELVTIDKVFDFGFKVRYFVKEVPYKYSHSMFCGTHGEDLTE